MAFPKEEYKNIPAVHLEVDNGHATRVPGRRSGHGSFLCLCLESFNNQAGTSLGL